MNYKVFVINPGSTSTKFAYYENESLLTKANVFHDSSVLLTFPTLNDQLPYRLKTINDYLEENQIDITGVDAIIVRGGSPYSLEGGVYTVDQRLYEDIRDNKGKMGHPSNLGVQIGKELQKVYGGLLLTADNVNVDEFSDVARMTGIKGIYRKSHLHILNSRGTAKLHAKLMGEKYEECNYIVAHIDGGITVSVHAHGRIVDGSDGTGGEGAYTPSRIGSVAARDVLEYARGKDPAEVDKLFTRSGGFTSHFGTSDSDKIHGWVEQGNKQAQRVWAGMIYNIAKFIGSMATVVDGKVDGIILTGGLVRFQDIVDGLRKSCSFIAPIYVYPDEVENEVLRDYALQVLRKEVEPKIYSGKPVWDGFDDEN